MELLQQLQAAAPPRVRADAHVRRLVVRRTDLFRQLGAELTDPPAHEPFRMGMAQRDALHVAERRRQRKLFLAADDRAQHAVDHARDALVASALRDIDRFAHDRMVGDAVQIPQLIEAQPQ
ncbi:hypothetical protein D3C86_1595090 [compost metagenome]